MKGSRTKGAEGQDGRALPSPWPALPGGSAAFRAQPARVWLLLIKESGKALA